MEWRITLDRQHHGDAGETDRTVGHLLLIKQLLIFQRINWFTSNIYPFTRDRLSSKLVLSV